MNTKVNHKRQLREWQDALFHQYWKIWAVSLQICRWNWRSSDTTDFSDASHHLYHPVSMYLSQKQNAQHRACQTWGRGLWSQNKTAWQMFTWLYITMQIHEEICRRCFNKRAGKKHKFTWNYFVSMFPSIDIGKLIPWCNHAKISRKRNSDILQAKFWCMTACLISIVSATY